MSVKKDMFYRDLNGSIVSISISEIKPNKKSLPKTGMKMCGRSSSEKLFRISSNKTILN